MLRIGIDVGGTFTDVYALAANGTARCKADTTHHDLQRGFINAVRGAVEKLGLSLDQALLQADSIVYSTTVGTNALIERKGPKLGLITTRGFEDTVMIGRSRNWADGLAPEAKYDRGRAQRPAPLIAREQVVGIRERIDNLGRVIVPINREDVLNRVQELVDLGVRGIVVVLLNSFTNPAHEQHVRDVIRQEYPETYLGFIPVFLSSEISPQSGEYRRSMTVILDAYLRVETEHHLARLADTLRDAGYHRPLFLVKNTGGLSSLSRTQPIHLFGSSPAAMVVASGYLGEKLGQKNVLATDMGGTSFDLGVVAEGRDRTYELDPIIDRWRVQIPYIAHWSIGAGGGSIASVTDGLLRVGPESAGSNPGPACYARGGTLPTVTDADVILGYINPDYFLGGRLKLDAERSRRAIREHVAEPMGISELEAAWNIKRLVDAFMGQEIYRICAVTSGQDPREFTIFAHGGAGSVHAAGFASYADVGLVAMFPFSSVFGAFGTLSMDILQTYERSLRTIVATAGDYNFVPEAVEEINVEVRHLIALSERDLDEEGFERSGVHLQLEAFMCYGQQRHQLIIKLPKLQLENIGDLELLCKLFNDAYRREFGHGASFPEAGIEVVRLRLSAIGPLPKFELAPPEQGPAGTSTPMDRRPAYWGPERGLLETPVYRMEALAPNMRLDGPVLIECEDTCVVVPPDWEFELDSRTVGWMRRTTAKGAR